MNEELEKTWHFLRNFEIDEFTNLKIEKIIILEKLNIKDVIFIYLKVFEKSWQKFFLDAGGGFWEDTEIFDFDKLNDIENCDNFVFKDYTESLNIKNEKISKIYCQPDNENSRIVIELKNSEKIILRCKNSKLFEDECEIKLE